MSLPWVCPCQASGMKYSVTIIITGFGSFGKNGFSPEGAKNGASLTGMEVCSRMVT
jgi:hypothetical protein